MSKTAIPRRFLRSSVSPEKGHQSIEGLSSILIAMVELTLINITK